MSEFDLIILTVYAVIFAILAYLFIKEIFNLKDIQRIFTCEHCNKLNTKISNGKHCDYCNRTFRNKKENWEHYLLFSISEINTNLKKLEYKYEYYRKQCLKELIICGLAAIIMGTAMLLKLI